MGLGKNLEFNRHNFDVVIEAYEELKLKYDERGMAMRETGSMVRSLFMPYIKRINEALREPSASHIKITKIQDALDELNKHTPVG